MARSVRAATAPPYPDLHPRVGAYPPWPPRSSPPQVFPSTSRLLAPPAMATSLVALLLMPAIVDKPVPAHRSSTSERPWPLLGLLATCPRTSPAPGSKTAWQDGHRALGPPDCACNPSLSCPIGVYPCTGSSSLGRWRLFVLALPRPAPFHLHNQRPAQDDPDQDEQAQRCDALHRRLQHHCPHDVRCHQDLQPQ